MADRTAFKVANWHARMNIIGLLIFIASFYLRTNSGARWISGRPLLPTIISVIGVLGLTIGGWLGGELVFKHRVGVTPSNVAPEKAEAKSHARAA